MHASGSGGSSKIPPSHEEVKRLVKVEQLSSPAKRRVPTDLNLSGLNEEQDSGETSAKRVAQSLPTPIERLQEGIETRPVGLSTIYSPTDGPNEDEPHRWILSGHRRRKDQSEPQIPTPPASAPPVPQKTFAALTQQQPQQFHRLAGSLELSQQECHLPDQLVALSPYSEAEQAKAKREASKVGLHTHNLSELIKDYQCFELSVRQVPEDPRLLQKLGTRVTFLRQHCSCVNKCAAEWCKLCPHQFDCSCSQKFTEVDDSKGDQGKSKDGEGDTSKGDISIGGMRVGEVGASGMGTGDMGTCGMDEDNMVRGGTGQGGTGKGDISKGNIGEGNMDTGGMDESDTVKGEDVWCPHMHVMYRMNMWAYGPNACLFIQEPYQNRMEVRHLRAFLLGPDTMAKETRNLYEEQFLYLYRSHKYNVMVNLSKDSSTCQCPPSLRCPMCLACYCRYACTCEDYWNANNVCEHCHIVAMKRHPNKAALFATFTPFGDDEPVADNTEVELLEVEHDVSFSIRMYNVRKHPLHGGMVMWEVKEDNEIHFLFKEKDESLCVCKIKDKSTKGQCCYRCQVCRFHYKCRCRLGDRTVCRHMHAVRRSEVGYPITPNFEKLTLYQKEPIDISPKHPVREPVGVVRSQPDQGQQ